MNQLKLPFDDVILPTSNNQNLQKILEEYYTEVPFCFLELSSDDQKIFVQALLDPPHASERLKEAARKYREQAEVLYNNADSISGRAAELEHIRRLVFPQE